MLAGNLRYYIEIYKPTLTEDEYGQQKETYTKVKATKADVIFGSGRKEEQNQEEIFTYPKTFVIRSYHTIMERYRIKFQGKMYRILNIDVDRRAGKISITTELIID